jgi:hypothetical protein
MINQAYKTRAIYSKKEYFFEENRLFLNREIQQFHGMQRTKKSSKLILVQNN